MPDRISGERQRRAWLLLLAAALAYLGWAALAWWWHLSAARWPLLPHYLFAMQDLPVLAGLAVGLIAIVPLSGPRPGDAAVTPPGWAIALAGVAILVAARIGRHVVFHDYSPSRDELMAEMAGAYLADGRIGWPIPVGWEGYARAILPEFSGPYGAGTIWTSVYLPVHAAIRAVFLRLGDADLASPVMLGVGLAALWDASRRLLPGRRDAQVVTIVLALTSTQLVATAMTPYAMTSHFALDMLWLALVVRGGLIADCLGAGILLLLTGLHQWHFPILFAGPLIGWLAWRRHWRSAAIQAGGLVLGVVLWAKLWPLWLAHHLGPASRGAGGPAPDIGAKIGSLFDRLDRWQPLLNIGRLIAWNNPLLLPFAALSLRVPSWRGREWLRQPPIVLPLAAIVLIGFATAMYQGYGWGFRYMHGSLGALALLAGYGWTWLSPDGRRPLRILWCSAIVSLVAAAYLVGTTERHVAGYARTLAAMRAARSDVVLVDLRGGYFMTDLVRFDAGRPDRPVIMSLAMLTRRQLVQLCDTYSVAVMDHGQFWALGVHPVNPVAAESDRLEGLRRTLDRLHCGRPVLR